MAEQEITFVGGSMNGPQTVDGEMFPRSHEGHSGWTISQIDGIVPSTALDPDPHIILLHIGTNDMRGDVSGAANRLGTLIDQIVMDLPNSLLVVAKIIPYPSQSSQVTTYNNAIPAIVEMRANAGKHVVLVDQFTGFPNNELADGVHPNATGYARMARVWHAAISSYLR
jgi:lysophospholipase L1-like esterase